MTLLDSWLRVIGFALLAFVAARLIGGVLRWWAMLTREDGDHE